MRVDDVFLMLFKGIVGHLIKTFPDGRTRFHVKHRKLPAHR